MLELPRIAALFAITAVAEILGCYLPWLVLKHDRTPWLLVPAAIALAVFAWLLTLHPDAAGRTCVRRDVYRGSPDVVVPC
jgi:small multidrug resistance family-3 protein